MFFYFRLFIVIFLSTTLYSFSPNEISQAKSMLASNPSLLKSYENQKINQNNSQYGNINEKTNNNIPTNEINNNPFIQDKNNEQNNKYLNNTIETDINCTTDESNITRLNPLKYRSNDEQLQKIKNQQFRIKEKKLQRYSKIFFQNSNQIIQNNIVTPTNYIINKGDIIKFWIYGATNVQQELEVDKRGNINIPQIGPVHIAGEKFGEVKDLLTNYLSSSYKNSKVVVDLNSFSTAQITVTGFVNSPGIYNTTSLSSVKDILIEAKGVSDVGSVRNIKVFRGNRLIDTIDYYHLFTQGQSHGDTVLQSGDVIHIPRAYGLITIDGEVNNPAIYEIEPGESLMHILHFAGGIKPTGYAKKIHIKRFNRNTYIDYLTLTQKQARHFIVKDGDEIYVGKLKKNNERYIEVIGNVINEGKKAIHNRKLKLSTFLHQQIINKRLDSFFLENTQLDYAMIKRIDKNLTPHVFHVNLEKVLNGEEDFTLHNRDQIYIFNNLDTKINPYVTIVDATTRDILQQQEILLQRIKLSEKIENQFPEIRNEMELFDTNISDGNYTSMYMDKINRIFQEANITKSKLLLQPGKFTYTKGMTLEDVINMAGIKRPFDRSRVKIVSQYKNKNDIKVNIINYEKNKNYLLKPFDTIHLFDIKETSPVPMADIIGEVVKPGSYEITKAMTLKELIESAGGLTQKAYPKQCEVIRYHLENGERKKKIFNINMEDINNFIVQRYDEINIKKIPYWDDKKTVTLKGEVKFPGEYIIHSGEKLSSVIKRAGGFTKEAFLYGAIFAREEIAQLQAESLQRSLSKLKEQVVLASLRSSGSKSMGKISIGEGVSAVNSLIAEAKKVKPIGRISIHLSKNLKEFDRSPSNLTLKSGDTLLIPARNDTVLVSGEVMNPMALTYQGDDVQTYIRKCGGITELADSEHIFVLHANGEAEKASIGSYLFSSNNVNIKQGDVIMIPKKIMFERGIDIAGNIVDMVYKLTLTLASMRTVGAI